ASFLGFTAVFAVFLVAVFRTAGGVETLWLAVAAAGFYFIQYQNFLNAPFWVLFLALYSLRQAGAAREDRPLRTIWRILAVAFVLISAALLGPMTHGLGGEGATSEGVAYLPYPPEGRNPTGLVVAEPLLRPIETKTVSIAEAMSPWAGDAECVISAGWAGVSLELAKVVAELPGPAFIADSISPYWYLAGVEPLADVAVWNYGSLRGLENADFVVVPVCAQKPSYKRVILVEMERQGVTLEPYSESEWATIYRRIEVPG
ncbi:MAG: hypothetical protein LJE62_04540, partial [Silicimonas sp.]|nr:hypothetical protein [Silicimonas sp.]